MSNIIMPRRAFLAAAGASAVSTVLPRSVFASAHVPAQPKTQPRVEYVSGMLGGHGKVKLALVASNDFSGSVKRDELGVDEINLQIEGTAQAFESMPVINAIKSTPGGILCTNAQFTELACQAVGWARLQDEQDCRNFAALIRAAGVDKRISGKNNTHIATSLDKFKTYLDLAPNESERKVIDVSFDGPENSEGKNTDTSNALLRSKANELERSGITINGLPISNEEPDMKAYSDAYLITSDGFSIEVKGYRQYADMLISKLELEIAGAKPPGSMAQRLG